MVLRFLIAIFGRRIILLYGGIACVLVGVLSALYLNANYAVQSYVDEQLAGIAWDSSLSHRSSVSQYPEFQAKLHAIPGVKDIGTMGLLRVRTRELDQSIYTEVNGHRVPTAWIVFVSTTDLNMLPPPLRTSSADPHGNRAAVLGDVGGIGSAALPGGSLLEIKQVPATNSEYDPDGDEKETRASASAPPVLLQTKVSTFIQIERAEINRWLLKSAGSISFLPENAIMVVVPMPEFKRLSVALDKAFADTPDIDSIYIPEITHLVRLDRGQFIKPWYYQDDIDRLQKVQDKLLRDVRDLTPFSTASGDTLATLTRMAAISKQIGMATLLLSIPLLWLGWLVSKMLSDLTLMNERRLIGLAIIRGIPGEHIARALIVSLAIGGLGGGILGLVLGLGLTIVLHTIAGAPFPPLTIIMAGVGYLLAFILLCTTLTIVSGWSIVRRVRSLRPREAIAHVAASGPEASNDRGSSLYTVAAVVALVLGAYKVLMWFGHDPVGLGTPIAGRTGLTIGLFDRGLDFVAVPLLLFGLLGIQRRRARVLQSLLAGVTTPIVGKLQWFASEHMMIHRNRVIATIFIASLAMSMALLPQVTADTFNSRLQRGLEVSLGGDIQIDYSLPELAGTGSELAASRTIQQAIKPKLGAIQRALHASGIVASSAFVEQLIDQEIYLPDQSGLTINLIESPKDYLKTVRYEESLGQTRPFSDIVRGAGTSGLVSSAGFLKVRKLPPDMSINLGYDGDTPIKDKFNDVAVFLPGQPTADVQQNDGYAAAEVDYLNYLVSADAWGLSTMDRFQSAGFGGLSVKPLKAVFLVRLAPGATNADVDKLIASLPIPPEDVRRLDVERQSLSRDMFIALTLSNMKVFLIGSLILSLAGIVAMGMVNFAAERRTFSLLRVRGLPPLTLFKLSLAIFAAPLLVGILLGVALGIVAGLGVSETIWRLPRISGVAGLLTNKVKFSMAAFGVISGFSLALIMVAAIFSAWPFRSVASESLRRSR